MKKTLSMLLFLTTLTLTLSACGAGKLEIEDYEWKMRTVMLSDAGVNSCATTEDFTWLFDAVKANAEQLRAYFQTATYNTTGDYKTTFFVNGIRAIIITWIDNDCADSVEQMNELAMREYRKLFEAV